MKPRDMVLNQIRHRETDIVPYTLDFEDGYEKKLDAWYGNTKWRDRLQPFIKFTCAVNTMKKTDTDRAGYRVDPFGSLWRMNLRPFHLEKPALENPSFKGYRWPPPEEFYGDRKQLDEARRFCDEHKDESFLLSWLGWGLFESSWGMRGFENILMDFAAEPEFIEELLDRLTDQFVAYVDFTCRALPDIDGLMFGDDWGDQRGVIIGPDRWRQLLKPRYARIYETAHAHGKFAISHSCGSVTDIMPDMIEIGLDVLESCQPEARDMNPYELKKQWGDRMTFWGGLGSQSTIPRGTPEDIRHEIRRLRREMPKGGGYILAPAKPIQPETPVENTVAILETLTEDQNRK